MARSVSDHRTAPHWVAFLAGAVAMLAVALAWAAFSQRDEASKAVRLAAEAANAMPAVVPPRLPEAPRIPDTPVPRPQ